MKNPKDKAEELVGKMMLGSKDRLYLRLAKQCALIAVDEIITFGNQVGIREPMMYWDKVKQEILEL